MIRRLWMLLRSQRPQYVLYCGVLLLEAVLSVYAALMIQRTVNVLLSDPHVAGSIVAALSALLAARAILFFITRGLLTRLSAEVGREIRLALYQKAEKLQLSAMDHLRPGFLLSLYNDDVSAIARFLCAQFPAMISDVAFLGLSLVYFIALDPLIAFLSVAVVLVSLPFLRKLANKLGMDNKAMLRARAELIAENENLNRSFLDIGLANAQENMLIPHERLSEQLRECEYKLEKTSAQNKLLLALQHNIGLLFLLLFTGISISMGRLDLGGAVAMYTMYARFSGAIRKGNSYFALFATAKGHVARLERFFESPDETYVADMVLSAQLPICLEHVSYGYSQDQIVFDDLSMCVGARGVAAIIGGSGSGKSTLGKLLCGYTPAFSGTISYNGVDFHQLNFLRQRQTLIYVSCDFFLIPQLVCDWLNVAPHEAVAELVRALRLEHVIQSGGVGWELALDPDAGNLSGGERQRLILLAALLHDAQLYVFDEMLSGVSLEMAREILVFVRAHKRDCSQLWITHRVETLEFFDQIYFLEDGTLNAGTHETLMGIANYRRFVKEAKDVS